MDKNYIKLIKKNATVIPELYAKYYNQEIDNLIRQKYTISEEFAILRQRESKPEEFAEYNAYAESCKQKIKAEWDAIEI